MKNLNRVFRKYRNPLLLITFAMPVVVLTILVTFIYGTINGSIVVLWISYTLLALVFGRVYCGYVCQFGMIQRFFNLIGEVLFKKPFEIPKRLDRYMRIFKYVFTSVLIIWSMFKLRILISDFPFSQYSDFWNDLGFIEGMLDWTIGIFIISAVIGSIMFKSFYCKYFCLKGSVFGLLSNVSASRVKVDKSKCTECKLCTINCPMNIQVHTLEAVKSMDCMHCQQCIAVCPRKAINNSFMGTAVSPAILMSITVITFILLLLVSSYLLNIVK